MKDKIKKLLREGLMQNDEKNIREVADFINFAKDFLGINDDIKVFLAFKRTPELVTTAYYNPNGHIMVYAKDRATIDIYRSIAHELVHHKQNLGGKLKDLVKDGEDGSLIENEANAVAGEIVRRYGKLNPNLYL
jgi:Zn-dependent peptidase ImmA (M78 family)